MAEQPSPSASAAHSSDLAFITTIEVKSPFAQFMPYELYLKFLMIRRTRNEIERYYGEDLKQQGLKCLGASGNQPTVELDFMSAARILKPTDNKELRQPIPRKFDELLGRNKVAFVVATTAEAEQAVSTHRGSPDDAYISKRLKGKAVRRYQQFTEDDEEFVGKVIRLIEDGSLPKATAKKVAASLKKPECFQTGPAAHASRSLAPREVILSSWLVPHDGNGGERE